MTDQTIVITGGNSGIGKQAAIELARQENRIILLCRNEMKAKNAVEDIKNQTGNKNVNYVLMDLSEFDSVRDGSTELLDMTDNIDVLVNNAGVYLSSRQENSDGIEKTFATNHLGHFLLTNLLLDKLKKSSPSRIVNVSSAAHRGSTINFDDINAEKSYSGFERYGMTKLCNILFTYSLADRLKDEDITANVLHPGFVATNFAKNNGLLYKIGMLLLRPFQKSSKRGSKPIIYLATSDEVKDITGKYFRDTNSIPFTSPKIKSVKSSKISYNQSIQDRLWSLSEDLTGLKTQT